MTIKDQDAPLPFDEIFHATCEFCGNAVDTRRDDVYQCAAGWVEVGSDSFSQITEYFNRWAHQHCVEREEEKARQRINEGIKTASPKIR